tara:strand:+ start:23 stop:5116 length:5094 start_codon:yes stop_codon:yes gene_type:complete
MNKDLDARIIPAGEYRDALNIQISKSENSKVGNLENILGNASVQSFQTTTGVANLKCIGQLADEVNSVVYLFFTDNETNDYIPTGAGSNHFIISYSALSFVSIILVKGAFLNFSQLNPLHGINILENLLFFTDNRNQPRVINVESANSVSTPLANPTFYTTEDQISVAKYSPYQCMELFQKSVLAPTASIPYETTMKDVSSKFLANGGEAKISNSPGTIPAGTVINITNISGQIVSGAPYSSAATVGLLNTQSNIITLQSAVVTEFIGSAPSIKLSAPITFTSSTSTLIFNQNPYYNPLFSGDPDYLEDKFTRFSYRFKFLDNEYSIFAPFTQSAFIPKQDGYFMYVNEEGLDKVEDQANAYRSSVVSFVENKVNEIKLIIPLPYTNYTLKDGLKIAEVDILYKESDAIAVKVIETIPISTIEKSAGVCKVNGTQAGVISAGGNINVKNIKGGITVGDSVIGPGIPVNSFITSFVATNPSNPVAGIIKINNDTTSDGLANEAALTIADPNYYVYTYNSTKPTKTLPESELVRVYDKVPIKSLAQEIAGNRVIYGNFQNKLTPPSSLDYNVACNDKSTFTLNEATGAYAGAAATYAAGANIVINIVKEGNGLFAGMEITSNEFGTIIPTGTLVTSTTSNTAGAATIQLDQAVTFPLGSGTGFILIFEPGGDVESTTSIIEYPNSSVKTNRNYQVGFVLSDKYGRTSGVILSNNTDVIAAGNPAIPYSGSTLYSPYIESSEDIDSWPGNSLKILFNQPITTNIYNGNVASAGYNPLGWYSYKVVVKQTEQEYYNVYLPGIMASYPQDQSLELSKTSHTVLINDNINKIPRDLTEVGPEQRQFRSSVKLFGRVQNTNELLNNTNGVVTNLGKSNTQYYPLTSSDTVSIISTLNDLFDYNPSDPELPSYFQQFYDLTSNPLIARISTSSKIGQVSTTNYKTGGAVVRNVVAPTSAPSGTSNIVQLTNVSLFGTTTLNDFLVTGEGVPNETYVIDYNTDRPTPPNPGEETIKLVNKDGNTVFVQLTPGTQLTFTETYGTSNRSIKTPGLQYLAVYETEPVESLIDIFWETSTSGLISDLNSAIINNQANPAAIGIGNWNTNAFKESLKKGEVNGDNYILSGPFVVINGFGVTIPLSTNDSLILASVYNELGNDVSSYFKLVPLSNSSWQIRTTSVEDDSDIAAENRYYDNIYYFPNSTGSNTNQERNFNFYFNAVIDNQETTGLLQSAFLRNVSPIIRQVITTTTTINLPQADITTNLNRSIELIATISSTNGAHNPALYNGLVGLDPANLTYEIFSQTFVNSGNAAVIEGEDIFGLSEPFLGSNNFLQCKLNNLQSNNLFLPSSKYKVIIRVRDGEGGDYKDQTIIIDMRLQIPQGKVLNGAVRVETNDFAIPLSTTSATVVLAETTFDWTSMTFTQFELEGSIPGIATSEIGWYYYAQGFFRDDITPAVAPTQNGSASLLTYNGVDPITPTTPVVIPRNSSQSGMNNQVQIPTQFGDPAGTNENPWFNYKWLHYYCTVRIVSIVALADSYMIEYSNPSDVDKIKPWQSVWGSTGALTGPGRPHPSYKSKNIVMSHDIANSKIEITDIDNNSEMVVGATVYFYKGNLGGYENKNPWYFVPFAPNVTIPIALQMTFALSPWTGVFYPYGINSFEVTSNTLPVTGQSGYGQFSEPGAFEQQESFPNVSGDAEITDPLINFDII